MSFKIKDNKGTAVLMTLLILASILTIALGASSIITSGLKMSRTQLQSTKAFFAAESGVEQSLWEVRKSQDFQFPQADQEVFTNDDIGNESSYAVNFSSRDTTVTFKSLGRFSDVTRSVSASFTIVGGIGRGGEGGGEGGLGGLGAECEADDDCEGVCLICDNGNCAESDDVCLSLDSSKPHCVAGTCYACEEDSHCTNLGYINYVCSQEQSTRGSCVCEDGWDDCDDNKNCDCNLSDSYCDAGQCLAAECTDDTDCEAGEICVMGECVIDDYDVHITDCQELQDIGLTLASRDLKYILDNNIECGNDTRNPTGALYNGGSGFDPIGAFTGELNGNDFEIRDLFIDRDTTNVALFKNLSTNGVIENLKLVNANITGATTTGGVVADNNEGRIENVQFIGNSSSVNGIDNVGGIAGTNNKDIINAYVESLNSITGEDMVGCLVGNNNTGTISDSEAKCKLNGARYLGGLAGQNTGQGEIKNSFASSTVTSTGNYAGGLVGYNNNSSTIDDSGARGIITGNKYVGGLVGYNRGVIQTSYAMSSVESKAGASAYAGGFVGRNQNLISNCYCFSDIKGSSVTGGFVGRNNNGASILYSYTVNENFEALEVNTVNGFVGQGSVDNTSYFNTDFYPSDRSAAGLNTQEMTDKNNFVNWDFAEGGTWKMVGAGYYPCLGWQSDDTCVQAEGAPAPPTGAIEISSCEELQMIGHLGDYGDLCDDSLCGDKASGYPLNADYVLSDNIDCSATKDGGSIWDDARFGGKGFDPIGGPVGGYFNGALNGNNKVISNLFINRPGENKVGLFSHLAGSIIKNLGIEGCDITGNINSGCLAGQQGTSASGYDNQTIIQDSFAQGTVNCNNDYCGGLIGQNTESWSSISNSYFSGAVNCSGDYCGGLVGWVMNGASINNSYATGDINSSGTRAGGLVGAWSGNSNMSNSYSASNVIHGSGTEFGGLIGLWDGTVNIESSYWNTDLDVPAVACGYGDCTDATGTTTEAMTESPYQATTFSSYSDTIWHIEDGYYPCHKWWTDLGNECPRPEGGGGGSSGGVIEISSCEELQMIGHPEYRSFCPVDACDDVDYPLDADYKITASFSCSKVQTCEAGSMWDKASSTSAGYVNGSECAGFDPIGDATEEFSGTFDGGSNTVSDLSINRPGIFHIGLFGRTNGAEISNINLSSIELSGANNIGSLIGYADNSQISSAYASGNINGHSALGGLIGWITNNTLIQNSYATVNVSGVMGIGGLTGLNNTNCSIINSFATGDVNGDSYVGGLCGSNLTDSSITNSFATGDVSGDRIVGGLVGSNTDNVTTTNSYSTGSVTGNTDKGGLIGKNETSSVLSSYWNLDIYSNDNDLGIGTSTQAMTKSPDQTNTFSTWNTTDIWDINDSFYPCHKWWTDLGNTCPRPPTTCAEGFSDCNGDGMCECDLSVSECSGGSCVFKPGYIQISSCEELQMIGHPEYRSFCSDTVCDDPDYPIDGNYIITTDFSCQKTETCLDKSMWDIDDPDSAGYIDGSTCGGFDSINSFGGTLNGYEHAIGGLYINRSGGLCLFSSANNGDFRNINLININFTSAVVDCARAGGLLCTAENTVIKNCYVEGKIKAGTSGGLIGMLLSNSAIKNSGVNIDLNSCYCGNCGGLVYYSKDSTIENSFSRGSIFNDQDRFGGGVTIGGFIGSAYNGEIINSYSTVNLENYGDAMSGGLGIGGFAGLIGTDTSIKNSYSIGNVENYGFSQGGSSPAVVGGFAGYDLANDIISSYWDIDIYADDNGLGDGTSTQAMIESPYQENTFSAWDSTDIWNIQDGYYPCHKWWTDLGNTCPAPAGMCLDSDSGIDKDNYGEISIGGSVVCSDQCSSFGVDGILQHRVKECACSYEAPNYYEQILCGENMKCTNGECIACTPQCGSKQCGDNGCGGSCGDCGANASCDANGLCDCDAGYDDCDNDGNCECEGACTWWFGCVSP